MDAEPPLGVPTASPAPPPRDGIQCCPSPLPRSAAPPAWPRGAQAAAAALLLAALALLGWHAYGASRWRARPTALEADAARTYRIDLNRADRAQLLQLPGVGEGLAGRIEDYRRRHGAFRSVDELRRVGGIGPVLLEKLRPLVWVEPPEREDGEEAAPYSPPPAPPAGQRDRPGKKALLSGRIDLNRANAAELQRLPGIGPKLSARIILARDKQPFRRVEDLRKVSGIGTKTLERLRPYVSVGSETLAARED
jgi:competence protein ComEA